MLGSTPEVMSSIIRLLTSSLGRKYIMAVTGLLLIGFVIVHMIGNWKLFSGPDAINHYAYFLKHNPYLLWSFRLGLLGIAVVHIVTAISLAVENRRARPIGYKRPATIQASLASLTMVVSGLIVLGFVIFHLLHFTVHAVDRSYAELHAPIDPAPGILQTLAPVSAFGQYHDVYTMVVKGFSNVWISGFYILSVGLLSLHLSHGFASMFQSLGWRNRSTAGILDWAARGLSAVIFLGMAAVPTAVLLNWVK